jgi:hypothetical protein
MFHLFQTYVIANASCCKCSMSRRGGADKVVPVGTSVLACVRSKADVAAGACIPYQQAGLGRRARQKQCVGRCGNSTLPGVAVACGRAAGATCNHAYKVIERESPAAYEHAK